MCYYVGIEKNVDGVTETTLFVIDLWSYGETHSLNNNINSLNCCDYLLVYSYHTAIVYLN